MKKLLFIDYLFPPLSADWRGIASAKYLPQFGWEPVIISASEKVSYPKDYSLLNQVPKETDIYRVWHREPSSRVWQFLLNKLKVNVSFPDEYRTWHAPALRKAREILRKEKFDLIYSASQPFTSAFIAMKLKEEFRIPWVADFLDGWYVNDFLHVHYRKTLLKPVYEFEKLRIRKGEGDIVRTADKVVTISWHVRKRLLEVHKDGNRQIDMNRIDVITDGYDEDVFEKLVPRFLYPDKLTIMFLGQYYPTFKEPILDFFQAVKELDSPAELVFIGREVASLQAIASNKATYVLNMPREKALSFAMGSDFLFVVMPFYAKWIPTKIYDYLRIGKPILALVPPDGDAAKIIQEAKGGVILSHDLEKMKRQLESIFEQWRQGKFKDFHPDWDYVAQFERRKIVQREASVFDEVVAHKTSENR